MQHKPRKLFHIARKPKPTANVEALPSVLELEAKLYQAVRLILVLSQVFVCAPSGTHRQLSSGNCKQQLLLGLHLCWCCTVYASLSTCVYSEYTMSNIDLPTVQKPLYFCEYLMYLIHILELIVATYYGRHKFRAFLRFVAEFDHALMAFAVKPDYMGIRQFLRRHVFLILVHFVCTAIIDYYYSNGIWVDYVRSTTVYVLPNLILHVSLVQYYALLTAIAERSIRLNELLKATLAQQTEVAQLHANLHKIRLLYSNIQLFTREVNDAFGHSVVLIYIGSFMNLSVNIFLIYKYMDDTSRSDFAWIMYSLVWSMMHVGKMFLILYYNHRVQHEKNTTALILNDIKGQNVEMEETITHFILQLIINTRTNVVCGVAELNMNFITSLLVAISTLFIFLLQYDITYEALTKTHNSGSPNRI